MTKLMSAKALAKPQLRGLLNSHIKKHLSIALTLSIISGFAYKTAIGDVRKQKYAEFYKNYDAEQDFQRMKAKGIFSCV